jgi:hypothetical protein
MPPYDMQLVQWIADRIRYATVQELIGVTCQIDNLRLLEADLSAVISQVLPDLGSLIDPEDRWIKETLIKHHVLDLTFAMQGNVIDDNAEGGVGLLGALGFLMDDDEAEQFEYVASLIGDNFEDPTLLGELQADLMEDRVVLRVLLKSIDETGRAFAVVDACITNAASVWLHKYPYY